jgi:hypothetical protein
VAGVRNPAHFLPPALQKKIGVADANSLGVTARGCYVDAQSS